MAGQVSAGGLGETQPSLPRAAGGFGSDGVLSDPRLLGGVALVAAGGAAVLVSLNPVLGIAGVGGSIAAFSLLAAGPRIVSIFLGALAALLAGYAFLGRGIAYLGLPPLYVGEMVLGVGVVTLIVCLPRGRPRFTELAILAFLGWGLLRTLPYLGTYQVDALRDAVLWAYGLFAVVIATVMEPRHVAALVRLYRRLVPVLLAWVPVAAVLTVAAPFTLPTVPGSDVPVVYFKAGDMAVHLAGVAAFVLVGLYAAHGRLNPIREGFLWFLWLADMAISGAISRSALFSAAVGATALLFVRSSARIFTVILISTVLFCTVLIVNPSVPLPGDVRAVSVQQLVSNVVSVFGSDDSGDLEGTKEWRLRWWDTILGYTINGPYFWTGKGFGVNLADDDGFQVTDDGSLRSPHSAHFDILGRMGVPGLAIWISIQVAFAIGLVRAILRARNLGNTAWVAFGGWIFAYWLAALINASFDVYLEGPQGGIWFWSLIGVGLVVIRHARTPITLEPQREQDGDRGKTAEQPATAVRGRLAGQAG